MSDGKRMSYGFAHKLAEQMVDLLSPVCARIEIAGSLRRHKETVGDIEIVLIPKPTLDLFGNEGFGAWQITEYLEQDGFILEKNGDYFKQAHLPFIASGETVNFDIFLTTPEKWGVILTIRTGSADFSHRLVTPRNKGGLLPSNLRVKDGRIWNGDEALETPKEADVFNVIGLAWIEPKDRV
jgi:DNA polymerase/3'-5' exonuclease PolX